MAARIARRKHEKALARRRKISEREPARAYRREYPAVALHPGDAPDGFVRLIREAVAAVRFDDRALFTRDETREFRRLKQDGLPAHPAAVVKYGDRLFEAVGPDRLLSYIPFSDVMLTMRPGGLDARFRALRRRRGPGGTAYHSPHEPTLDVGGRRLIVGFSTHAALRVCERAVPTWRTYGGLGNAYGLLDGTLEYEFCVLPGGEAGFTFYDNCEFVMVDRGRAVARSAAMAMGVLDTDLVPGRPYAYRIGYCPAVVEGDVFKAKTLLYPGQRGTPEHALILRHEWDRAERRRKLAEAEQLDAARVGETWDFGLLRWFHLNGVPQVIPRHVRCAR